MINLDRKCRIVFRAMTIEKFRGIKHMTVLYELYIHDLDRSHDYIWK